MCLVVRKLLKGFGLIKNNVVAESLNRGTNTAMAYVLHKFPEKSQIETY